MASLRLGMTHGQFRRLPLRERARMACFIEWEESREWLAEMAQTEANQDQAVRAMVREGAGGV